MGIRLLTSGGGGVNIEPASSIATDVTLTVPVTGGEIPLKDGSGTITATSFVGDGSGLTGIAGGFSNMQVFTSSGTFTVPSGITKVKVTVVGGGGGGGNGSGGNGQRGAGGGGGGAAIKIISGLTPSSSISVTVGGGGAAVSAGGTSSFGAYCSATGGGAGISNASYITTRGGVGSGGDLNLSGNPPIDTSASYIKGGGTIFAPPSPNDRTSVPGAGTAGLTYGGGGGGAYTTTTGTQTGGAGASGVVIVEY